MTLKSEVLRFFADRNPFWGIPGFIMTIWSGLMAMRSNQHCWIEPTDQSILWTRKAPILFILATNLLILANIIRILVMQVQQGNVDRNSTQSKKVKIQKKKIEILFAYFQARVGLKATILLSPLLGITYIILLVNPSNETSIDGQTPAIGFVIFIYVNTILQGFQGAIVSTFYCFVNSEIQRNLKRKFYGLQRRISNRRAV